MRSSCWKLPIGCALVLLLVTGCQTYYPNAYPGPYGAPQPGIVPNGTIVNPGLTPTPADPNGQWQQTPQPGASSSGGQGDPPEFNPQGGGFSEPGTRNRVPIYPDAGELGAPPLGEPSQGSTDGTPSPFSEVSGASIEQETVEYVTTETGAADMVEQAAHFEAPVELSPVPETHTVRRDTNKSALDPYDYDRENHRWLRGVMEYDPTDKSWHVMYSLRPDESDPFGGDLALIDDPILEDLQDQDVVYIEGQVDPRQRDHYGKPRYRIDHLLHLVPPTNKDDESPSGSPLAINPASASQ